ncbi:LuxR C-terminal-related transcriptional regulator [Catalinimonas niigatensis]|uniref:LuxR C-terminal-related transcriptional regulator n=1 Tax=Catalinimonas niigatensis TaxID=1397264 RepID=UPI0026651DC3|nr:LuxR C-terminal-related transcriptional regulator [Catalinimonas niigatensis]WPP49971.1 LuxR C-terminal-related transcriptional regulator [Catalinimonas niigatensis]
MKSFRQLQCCWEQQPFVPTEKHAEPYWQALPGGIGPSFTYVYDHVHSQYYHIDSSLQGILGYDAKEVKQEGLSFLDSIIHPEDREPVMQLLQEVWQLILTQPGPFRKDYTMSIDYRLKHANGQYIHLIQQNNILTTDAGGNVIYSMGTCFDISHWQKPTPCTLNLYYNNSLFKRWSATPPILISQREQEVVQEICEGKTSLEIAEQLHISMHTVNTHRKAIMRKLGIKGTPALVHFAQQHQLI